MARYWVPRRTDESYERLQKRYGVAPAGSQPHPDHPDPAANGGPGPRLAMGAYDEDTQTCVRDMLGMCTARPGRRRLGVLVGSCGFLEDLLSSIQRIEPNFELKSVV
jgi:hypothetical protein